MKMNETNFAVLVSYVTRFADHPLEYYQVVELHNAVEACLLQEQLGTRPVVDASVVHDLVSNMNQPGKKIEAIRAWRTLTGEGLKEAKDAVEKYWTIS